jgi:hypothetical protein
MRFLDLGRTRNRDAHRIRLEDPHQIPAAISVTSTTTALLRKRDIMRTRTRRLYSCNTWAIRNTDLADTPSARRNEYAPGPHLPQRNWTVASHQRRGAEAGRLPDGTWDTDAVDHLIGSRDGDNRVAGGYHALARLASRAGSATTFQATVNNNVDSGGAIIKGRLVANPAMVPHVDLRSCRIHLPSGGPADRPSDRRLVTAAFDLSETFASQPGDPR